MISKFLEKTQLEFSKGTQTQNNIWLSIRNGQLYNRTPKWFQFYDKNDQNISTENNPKEEEKQNKLAAEKVHSSRVTSSKIVPTLGE